MERKMPKEEGDFGQIGHFQIEFHSDGRFWCTDMSKNN